MDTATVLHRCTPQELLEVENLVKAAEGAKHLNGEATLLQDHIKKLFIRQTTTPQLKDRA
jgi:hypothetical protein